MRTAVATADHEALILEVDGDQVVIDESVLDFSDLTVQEINTISKLIDHGPLFDEGEPTPLGVATFIFVKLARTREWGESHFAAVVPLLTSWLIDDLELID